MNLKQGGLEEMGNSITSKLVTGYSLNLILLSPQARDSPGIYSHLQQVSLEPLGISSRERPILNLSLHVQHCSVSAGQVGGQGNQRKKKTIEQKGSCLSLRRFQKLFETGSLIFIQHEKSQKSWHYIIWCQSCIEFKKHITTSMKN